MACGCHGTTPRLPPSSHSPLAWQPPGTPTSWRRWPASSARRCAPSTMNNTSKTRLTGTVCQHLDAFVLAITPSPAPTDEQCKQDKPHRCCASSHQCCTHGGQSLAWWSQVKLSYQQLEGLKAHRVQGLCTALPAHPEDSICVANPTLLT